MKIRPSVLTAFIVAVLALPLRAETTSIVFNDAFAVAGFQSLVGASSSFVSLQTNVVRGSDPSALGASLTVTVSKFDPDADDNVLTATGSTTSLAYSIKNGHATVTATVVVTDPDLGVSFPVDVNLVWDPTSNQSDFTHQVQHFDIPGQKIVVRTLGRTYSTTVSGSITDGVTDYAVGDEASFIGDVKGGSVVVTKH